MSLRGPWKNGKGIKSGVRWSGDHVLAWLKTNKLLIERQALSLLTDEQFEEFAKTRSLVRDLHYYPPV